MTVIASHLAHPQPSPWTASVNSSVFWIIWMVVNWSLQTETFNHLVTNRFQCFSVLAFSGVACCCLVLLVVACCCCLVLLGVACCCLLLPVVACCCLLLPVVACWCLLVPVGACWCLLVLVGSCWCLLVLVGACGACWCLLVLVGACWCLLVLVGVILCEPRWPSQMIQAPTPPHNEHTTTPTPQKKSWPNAVWPAKFGQIMLAKCGQLTLAKCGIGQIRSCQRLVLRLGSAHFPHFTSTIYRVYPAAGRDVCPSRQLVLAARRPSCTLARVMLSLPPRQQSGLLRGLNVSEQIQKRVPVSSFCVALTRHHVRHQHRCPEVVSL